MLMPRQIQMALLFVRQRPIVLMQLSVLLCSEEL